MYGMIHCGIREMVTEQLGQAKWTALERKARITAADQVTLSVYDDALTMRFIDAASDALCLTQPQCLQVFGRYWVKFAAKGSFSAIMNFTGGDIVTFVGNLDRMHRAVVSTLPRARMPSFQIAEHGPGFFRVIYASERTGLGMFVTGLLEGILEHFSLSGEVILLSEKGREIEFLVKYEIV